MWRLGQDFWSRNITIRPFTARSHQQDRGLYSGNYWKTGLQKVCFYVFISIFSNSIFIVYLLKRSSQFLLTPLYLYCLWGLFSKINWVLSSSRNYNEIFVPDTLLTSTAAGWWTPSPGTRRTSTRSGPPPAAAIGPRGRYFMSLPMKIDTEKVVKRR